jgi:hypothetical protein
VIVWNEGRADEKIQIVPLRFEGERRAFAWTLRGRTVAEATPTPQPQPGARERREERTQ